MEHQVIVGKRIDLEKMKENYLRIPVSFRPKGAHLNIQFLTYDADQTAKIELYFTSLSGLPNRTVLPIELTEKFCTIDLDRSEYFETKNNYLMLGLRSDKKISVELTVVANS
jgi:hypothetical protein